MEKLITNFKISFTKGDTYALAVRFKNITEDLHSAFFTVKENPDDEPLLQKSLGYGIDKIDDREYKDEKTYKVQLQPFDTSNLEANVQYLYDLQVTLGNVVKTVLSGVFMVHHSVTGTASLTTPTLEVEIDEELETEIATVEATKGIEYEQDPVARGLIGNLSDLGTTNKRTIVQAINEVKQGAIQAVADAYGELDEKIASSNDSLVKALDTERGERKTKDDEFTNSLNNLNGRVVEQSINTEKIISGEKTVGISELSKRAETVDTLGDMSIEHQLDSDRWGDTIYVFTAGGRKNYLTAEVKCTSNYSAVRTSMQFKTTSVASIDTAYDIMEYNNKYYYIWHASKGYVGASVVIGDELAKVQEDEAITVKFYKSAKILNAVIAQYASSDTKYGTIEQRLEELENGSAVSSPYGITKTGVYVVNVRNISDDTRYSLLLDIQDLSINVKSAGAYYGGNYNNGVLFNASTKTLVPFDSGGSDEDKINIVSARRIL